MPVPADSHWLSWKLMKLFARLPVQMTPKPSEVVASCTASRPHKPEHAAQTEASRQTDRERERVRARSPLHNKSYCSYQHLWIHTGAVPWAVLQCRLQIVIAGVNQSTTLVRATETSIARCTPCLLLCRRQPTL